MKRFFSLMLVALLLVTAVPFQAFAAGTCGITGGEHKYSDWYYENDDAKPTCTEEGVQIRHCINAPADNPSATCGAHDEQTKKVAALGHDSQVTTTAATCTEDGKKVTTCKRDSCDYSNEETLKAPGHDWDEGTQTKPATCADAGSKLFTCDVCDETKTEVIEQLTTHTYQNGACSVCGVPADANDTNSNYALTFKYLNANGAWTTSLVTVAPGGTISLPTIPLVSGKDHIGWNTLQNGTGTAVNAGDKWYIGMADTIYAIYEDDSTEDGLVDLTVYAHYYVDGEYHHKERLFVKSFEKTAKNTMFTWLYSNAGLQQTQAALEEEGYQWTSKIFYDYYDDGAVTEADLKSDGNKSVYVKVTSKKEIEATVLLHVHTSKTRAINRTISMAGYTAGDYVSYAEALAAVKKYYTGTNLSMSDLYNESDWEDLLDGAGSSSGAKSVKVENNGTTEIHVILKNATAKSNNADTTNPKTGDYIMIAVGTMVLAAAAVITMAEMKKRKMI